MKAYSPLRGWDRTRLGLGACAIGLAVPSAAVLMFSDDADRRWVAVALGLSQPAPACTGSAATLPACGMQAARVAQVQAPAPANSAAIGREAPAP